MQEQAIKAIEVYRERFAPIGVLENGLFDGVDEMLKCASNRGVHLAVASSKPECFVRQILQHFGIEQYFQVIVGSELDGTRGTKEEVVEEALRQLGILELPLDERHRDCAMIGDRKFDIQGAKAHGLTSVGVSFGFANPGELEAEGAEYIVDSIDELREFICGEGNA